MCVFLFVPRHFGVCTICVFSSLLLNLSFDYWVTVGNVCVCVGGGGGEVTVSLRTLSGH